MKEPYRDWAEGHVKRVRDILNASRSEHTQVVKDRIQSVEQMKDVVSVTQGLFALSKVRFSPICSLPPPYAVSSRKTRAASSAPSPPLEWCPDARMQETAQLESEAFVQRQKVALAGEVKAVLDSWVRFEQQAKESEQADLVKSVVDSVLKSLNDPKTQKDVLASAVAEIERECTVSHLRMRGLMGCLVLQSWSRARLSRRYCSQYVVGSADRFNVQLLLLNSFWARISVTCGGQRVLALRSIRLSSKIWYADRCFWGCVGASQTGVCKQRKIDSYRRT